MKRSQEVRPGNRFSLSNLGSPDKPKQIHHLYKILYFSLQKEMRMLQGNLKLDVPVTTNQGTLMGADDQLVGIQVEPDDLTQDLNNPSIYTAEWDHPSVSITVTVQHDGSTVIDTIPKSIVHENTLQSR